MDLKDTLTIFTVKAGLHPPHAEPHERFADNLIAA